MATLTIDLPDETFAALQRSPRELSQIDGLTSGSRTRERER